MALLSITSPHTQGARRTTQVMLWVIVATLPGLLAQTWFFGWGNLINVLWCMLLALGFEAAILALRRRPLGFYLKDGSAAVTGVLLGLALPPLGPWWLPVVAVGFALIFAKHLYGGLGYNPFNPAMAGYALVLVSFPVAMTTNWAQPPALGGAHLGPIDTVLQIFAGHANAAGAGVDAYTGATPLDVYKHRIGAELADSVRQDPVFNGFIAYGWEWVNLGFLAGGLLLLVRGIIGWQVPTAMLGSLGLLSLALGWDPDTSTPFALHMLGGGTMLGAFFIATDPVSGATSVRGKLVFGAGVGLLLYVIRSYGSYPDAVAFAVLLMNFAAPFIDYYTQPRTFGHNRPRRGLSGGSR